VKSIIVAVREGHQKQFPMNSPEIKKQVKLFFPSFRRDFKKNFLAL
jgi:hypothetical protein